MMAAPTLTELGLYFAMLSLLAVGGANAVIPDMHRQLVELNGWMGSQEFAALVALSQAAPGPNVLIVSLLGWKMAGLAGALVATAAMCLPSSLLAYIFHRWWRRLPPTAWRQAVQAGLASVAVGLTLSSGWVLTLAASTHAMSYVVTAATAILALSTRWHPLWLFGAAAGLGWLGWV